MDERYPGQRVDPIEDECLLGYSLRQDATGRFQCWTVARDSLRRKVALGNLGAASWLSGDMWRSEYLARRCGLDPEAIRSLTLMPALERLFPGKPVGIQ
jgi:hypothetical protein